MKTPVKVRKFCVPILLMCAVAPSFLRAETFGATMDAVGRRAGGIMTPVNQITTPAGTQVELPGMRPQALALSPSGQLLVTAGLTHELVVLNPATGEIAQRVQLPSDQVAEPSPVTSEIMNPDAKAQLSFTGLAFSPDGSRIYMANVNGDIKVFGVGQDNKVAPLFSMALPLANVLGRTNEIPAGIAVSPDGKKLYVALNLANRLAELDALTGKVLRTWDVGVAPYDVVLAGKKIYVSNWGGRRPAADSVTATAGHGTLVRVDDRSIASEGSVTVIGADGAVSQEIVTGLHACALALSPNGKYLVVANAASDSLSVIDTRTDKIVETICARQNPADLFGAQPNALAFDKSGKKIYVCNGTQNAVAVIEFKPGESKLLGLIPAGWFPGAVVCDAKAKKIYVANIKNIGDKKDKPRVGFGLGTGYNSKQYTGSISLVPVPSEKELAAYTQTALMNLRYPLLAQAKLPAREGQPAQPVPERAGEPSVIQHVIYIIKENRTYDQVFGDVETGNGDAGLCAFGERVTPNLHRLVRDFVLLDNTYCCSALSADGHEWTDTAMATDYMEREFAGFPRSYPSGGDGDASKDALAYSPAGFIWNDALAHGKTVRDYGEFATSTAHWKDPKHKGKPRWTDYYHQLLEGTDDLVISSEPDLDALKPYLVTNTVGWNLDIPDQFRARKFIADLKDFDSTGKFPDLTIIWLPNDHTSATKGGSPTPAAQVADNDLAFGQIVEAVSHSSIWTNTCILAIEDDPQNGWDHVSGYRTTAYAIGPYVKRGATVHTQYNQTSLLRTMELMLGLPPMNQMDATATPMFDCFTNTPDFTAYSAVTNNVPLDEMNPPSKKVLDAQLRRDAVVSAKLPLDKEDQCPEDVLNQILWRAMKGTQVPYPAWAVKPAADND
ncbi:MAG TPA: beta-propeller fold lactonase family protein [Candidatus Acidoferrales bacterium]|jgi:YVTN family beta-propeller protein|nr:beta-propeller fold lactonase family protein [Candidatus Acidoferrales bacterium]